MEKIIVLTKFIPAPSFSGGAVRSRAWIRFLSKYYSIILLGFWDKKFNNTRIKELDFVDEMYGFEFVRTKTSLLKTAIKAVVHNQAVVLQQYYSDEMQEKINKIIDTQDINMIFCEELSTMQYVKRITDIPIVFDDHNIEYELQERSAISSAFYFRPILRREAACVRKFEKKAWATAGLSFFVSERDCQMAMENADAKITCGVVENTFSGKGIINKSCSDWYDEPTCIFVGNLSWKPNHHGLLHFFDNIYPEVKRQVPALKLILLGSAAPEDILSFVNGIDIVVKENIEEEEKREILSRCWLTLVPVYFGSGTRIKILEYWAHSKAVLSTQIGAEGLHSSQGTIILDDDVELRNEMISLLKDKQRLENLGLINRGLFDMYYEEETIYADSLFNAITAKLNE